MTDFKHCAIRMLHPIAIKFAAHGYSLVRVERLYPLLTKPAALDMEIKSQDYTIPPYISEKIKRLHKTNSYDSYLEEAKLLFQIIVSALAYKDPGILGRVKSIQFTIHVRYKHHREIIFDFTSFIDRLFGYIVTQRKHEDILREIQGERISLTVVFNTDDDRDDHNAWTDLGYTR